MNWGEEVLAIAVTAATLERVLGDDDDRYEGEYEKNLGERSRWTVGG